VPTLRDLRLRHYLTQQELADQAHVARSTVTAIEQGLQRPRIPTARALARALGVDPNTIDWPAAPPGNDDRVS